MDPVKELRSDDNDPLFDKTNMLRKDFPSDFRQIRYFTLLIVQSAPSEIKELNLLEQQISEVIKNAVKHGNHCDINKKVTVWYSFSPTHAHVIVQDEGEGFKDLEKWNEFNLRIMFLIVRKIPILRTEEMLCLPLWNTGTEALFITVNVTPSLC